MCAWGTTTPVTITRPADTTHTHQETIEPVPIDTCIAPLVAALQHAGIITRASCCGHGHTRGSIILDDGRVLIITDREDGLTLAAQDHRRAS